MKLRLIKISDKKYLLLKPYEDINKGEYFLYLKEAIYFANNNINVHNSETHCKIISCTDKIDGCSLIDINKVVSLLKKDELNITALGNQWALDNADRTMETNSALNKGFVGGFNSALEINKDKKYTLNDIKEIIMSMNSEEFNELKMREDFGREQGKAIEIFVNGFMKRKEKNEWDVEVESVTIPVHSKKWDKLIGEENPKLNEQGQVNILSIIK